MTQWILSLLNEARTGLYYAGAVVVPLLHLALAAAVWRDARSRARHGHAPVIVGAALWAVLTLVTGLAGFALYWAAHHSSWRGTPTATR